MRVNTLQAGVWINPWIRKNPQQLREKSVYSNYGMMVAANDDTEQVWNPFNEGDYVTKKLAKCLWNLRTKSTLNKR